MRAITDARRCKPVPRPAADVKASPCTWQAELAEHLAEMGHVLSASPEGLLNTLETMDLSTLVRTQREGRPGFPARVGLSVRPGRKFLQKRADQQLRAVGSGSAIHERCIILLAAPA